MTFKNYRDQSRDIHWGTNNDNDSLSLGQVNCGSIIGGGLLAILGIVVEHACIHWREIRAKRSWRDWK